MSGSLSYLILANIQKRSNHGTIIRTAAAMGVAEIAIVGAPKIMLKGDFGSASHVRFSHFRKLADAVKYYRVERKACICGIEIAPEAEPIQTHPFRGSTAFMIGNEGQGLLDAQIATCDHLVYIPQHSQATASLNVNAATAVALHHFATWAGLPEASRSGAKFIVADSPQAVPLSGVGLRQMRRELDADGISIRERWNRDVPS